MRKLYNGVDFHIQKLYAFSQHDIHLPNTLCHIKRQIIPCDLKPSETFKSFMVQYFKVY